MWEPIQSSELWSHRGLAASPPAPVAKRDVISLVGVAWKLHWEDSDEALSLGGYADLAKVALDRIMGILVLSYPSPWQRPDIPVRANRTEPQKHLRILLDDDVNARDWHRPQNHPPILLR